MIKIGTKFIICGHEELKSKGWLCDFGAVVENYSHDNFPGNCLTFEMIDKYCGQILTVVKKYNKIEWYFVEENKWTWPVSTFLSGNIVSHTCEEGVTPIDGWFICKLCGTNLRIIK